jgi:hypothetical protein
LTFSVLTKINSLQYPILNFSVLTKLILYNNPF